MRATFRRQLRPGKLSKAPRHELCGTLPWTFAIQWQGQLFYHILGLLAGLSVEAKTTQSELDRYVANICKLVRKGLANISLCRCTSINVNGVLHFAPKASTDPTCHSWVM